MGLSFGKIASVLGGGQLGGLGAAGASAGYDAVDHAADEAAAEAGSYHDQDIDQGTKDIIQGQADRANRSEDEFASAALNGSDQTAGLLRAQGQDMHAKALGGQDGGLQEAINNKAAKSYDVALNNIQRREKSNAPVNKFNAMDNAQHALEAERQIHKARVQRQMVARNNADAARNGVIAGVLSIGGTVAGGIVGAAAGNPMMGAQIGGAAGSGAGGTLNQNQQQMGGGR